MMNNEDLTLQEINNCICRQKSFIVEAGAGSGKTKSLVNAIKYVLNNKSHDLKNGKKIACITYTNVAKDEIINRIGLSEDVFVGTIHEFLWDNIKGYQSNLKKVLIESESNKYPNIEDKVQHINIVYGEYGRNVENGIISHDEVIDYSIKIFQKNKKLNKITCDKYPFIFIDEYQDTHPNIVNEILLKLDKSVLGFFGDAMQKIYVHGIGEIKSDKLQVITKLINYRCSKQVINFLNKIRTDIQQIPYTDNLDGSISFYDYSEDLNFNIHGIVDCISKKQNQDSDSYKILMLTHRVIANNLGYNNLLECYNDFSRFGREMLTNKEETYSEFLGRLEDLIYFFDNKQYGAFFSCFNRDDFIINKHSDKTKVKNLIDTLKKKRELTIGDVIDYVMKEKLLRKTKKIDDFERKMLDASNHDKDKYVKYVKFYEQLRQISYNEYINMNSFSQEHSPFSTKHGVKGKEYKNVIVVIDDQSWNQYNFNDLFVSNNNNNKNINRLDRTRKLFYVCCSRARNNLVIFCKTKVSHNTIMGCEVLKPLML